MSTINPGLFSRVLHALGDHWHQPAGFSFELTPLRRVPGGCRLSVSNATLYNPDTAGSLNFEPGDEVGEPIKRLHAAMTAPRMPNVKAYRVPSASSATVQR